MINNKDNDKYKIIYDYFNGEKINKEKNEITIESTEAIYKLFDLEEELDWGYFFRGQAKREWTLESGYKRLYDYKNLHNNYENFKEILEGISKDINSEDDYTKRDKSFFQIIAEMQHNGMKTILIDFSSNIHHSLFFAFLDNLEENNSKEECSIYILYFEKNRVKYEINKIKEFNEQNYIYDPKKLLLLKSTQLRSMAQESFFILDNLEDKEWEKKALKIIIKNKPEHLRIINEELKRKKITAKIIYPDIYGIYWHHIKKIDSTKGVNKSGEKKQSKHLTIKKRYGKSIEEHKSNSEDNEKYADVCYFKGNSLSWLGKYEEAIKWYDKAIKITPQYADAYYSKGNSLARLGKRKEAIKCYDKAIEINPQYADAYYFKGNTLTRLGKREEAIKCYDKAIKINPQHDDAYYSKGNTLTRLGKRKEAIKCYDKAIEIKPKHADAYYFKGNSLSRLGKHEEAIKCYDEALKIAKKE